VILVFRLRRGAFHPYVRIPARRGSSRHRLRLADRVYPAREGSSTVGVMFARDGSVRTCLLTLDLQPSDGAVAWRATVERVTREVSRSSDGVGASFPFYPRTAE